MTKEQQESLKVVRTYVIQPHTLYNVFELNDLIRVPTTRGKHFSTIIIEIKR